ncbi:hypothetical protein E6O75_ATG06668 [Venturia nashicola]|uniref:Uncharacterized protein n=1 Tax=Venturia nashicola TaxID=86259 RepID=A0A4Z1NT01_9PEZI|nr:hypothetical protein E6O75_ATG06668 [Venturia nashicola]
MGSILSIPPPSPPPPTPPHPFNLPNLPPEIRSTILHHAFNTPYKTDIATITQRYYLEEEDSTWDSLGTGALPLQETYSLALRLSEAFRGNGVLTGDLADVLRWVVADVDVRIGRVHGRVDEAVCKLAGGIRLMVFCSLRGVAQERAMGREWCDDWEWLSLEWLVYNHYKMDGWEIGNLRKTGVEDAWEKVDCCDGGESVRICYLTGVEYYRDCLADGGEGWCCEPIQRIL